MTTRDPWDDDRLATAFATRAARCPRPSGLPDAIVARLRTPERPATRWHRLVGPLAIALLLIAAIAGGAAILGQPDRATDPPVTFRAGPTADVRTLDAGTFSFRYPAGWHAYDSTAESAGGSSIAVLGNVAVDPACGDEGHVEAACVHARPLAPGEIRMNVGTGTLQDGTLETRPAISDGTTTRLEVAGRPAILDDIESSADDIYGADVSLHLYVALPGDGTRIVLVDLIAREPEAGAAREAMQQVVDSFRFAGDPAPTAPAGTVDSPEPSPQVPTPAPSSAATTVVLAGEEHPPVMVRFVDEAGVVSGAQPADAATIAGPDWDDRPQVLRVQPRTVLVRWIGSPCDSVMDLTVTRAADDGLAFRLGGDRPACDSIGVPRGLMIGLGAGAGGPLTLIDDQTMYIFPDPVAGLQVMDVRQALELQARDGNDREIAVFGWYERPAAVCLGFDADLPLLDSGCRQQALLRARPDTRASVPTIPVVVVAEDGADDRLGDGTLRRAVMVGHFDDRRSVACEPARREACRATFVVDAMWLDDEMVPPAWAWTPPSGPAPFEPDATPTRAVDRAREYVDGEATILGVGLVPMESLRRLEPTIDEPRLRGGFWHWHVTVLEPGSERVRTFVIPDASLGASDDFTAWEVVDGVAVPAHLVGTGQSPGAS